MDTKQRVQALKRMKCFTPVCPEHGEGESKLSITVSNLQRCCSKATFREEGRTP